jgi:hypothetical protein
MEIKKLTPKTVDAARQKSSRWQYLGRESTLFDETAVWAMPVKNMGLILRVTVVRNGEAHTSVLPPVPCGAYIQAVLNESGELQEQMFELDKISLPPGAIEQRPHIVVKEE